MCLTHQCNLRCVYCYQSHDSNHEMTLETAIRSVNDTMLKLKEPSTIEFILFGGEPLLRFELFKDIVEYTFSIQTVHKCRFFAATNGVLLNETMKTWFQINKDNVVLGLSLDGNKYSHNTNRPNSFDKIDLDFFSQTWPSQNVKMTVSSKTLANYADDVKYIHSLGFNINGGDLCLGKEDWRNGQYVKLFASQLNELVDYYSDEGNDFYNAIFDIDIASCAAPNKSMKKNCGVGDKLFFYDADGCVYPCTFITPMTFSMHQLHRIKGIDFSDPANFTDLECFSNCYLYPICKKCPAENLLNNGDFKKWDRSKCAFTELIALAKAELETRCILKFPTLYDNTKLYYTIEAIKSIRSQYLSKYKGIISFIRE